MLLWTGHACASPSWPRPWRPCERAETSSRAPSWWSSASTLSIDRTSAARSRVGRPGHRDVPGLWEGGAFRGAEEERLRLLADALEAGAEYVDVEWKALSPAFAGGRHRDRIVVSMHDFSGIPEDLAERVTGDARNRRWHREGRGHGAPVHRQPHAPGPRPARRDADGRHRDGRGRARDARAGGTVRFALELRGRHRSPAARARSAPRAMRDEFRAATRSGPDTALYGVVGRPVAHSLSPAMHNAAFAALDLDAVYLPLAAADFEDFRQFAEAMRSSGRQRHRPLQGAGVRTRRRRRCRRRQARSRQHPAAPRRTLGRAQHRRGRLHGPPRRARRGAEGLRATVLGGGRGRAVGGDGAAPGRRARDDRRPAARPGLASGRARGRDAAQWPPAPGSWDLLVNATPVGTSPAVDQSPLDAASLDGRLVYDLVYNPPRTRLLADAVAARLRRDRRPGHAGRTGRRAVHVVDRRRAVRGGHASAALARLHEEHASP